MPSAYRLIMLAILMNLIIPIGLVVYENSLVYNNEPLSLSTNTGDIIGAGVASEESQIDPESYTQASGWGNMFSMAGRIFKEFVRGLVPVPIFYDTSASQMDIALVFYVTLVRALINYILMIKLFLIFWNKDTL